MVWNVNMIVMEISHDIQRYDYNIVNQNSRYDVLSKKIIFNNIIVFI